jgi:hypothetical protein
MRWRTITTAVAALLAAVSSAGSVAAREIRLPISVEPPVIRDALQKDLFNDSAGRAVLWGEPGSCSYFYLVEPAVDGEVDRLRVFAKGDAKLGTDLGMGCLSPIGWTGFLEVFERPRLDGWMLHFDVVDSNLYDEARNKQNLIGQLWDRIKESIEPHFGAVTIDLSKPFRELRDFLLTVVGNGPQAAELAHALDSLRPVSARALPRGIVVDAALEVPEPPAGPVVVATEPPLTQEEIDAFTERANQWDAFLTFVVKTLGVKTLSKETRRTLLDTLLDARYAIVAILAEPSRHQDPVRTLFVKSWDRLRPVADEIARGLPGAEAAKVLTFVAAGDALTALDQLGPSFGVEVSAEGLRRMARMIAPQEARDPLEYDPGGVDPMLRRFLGMTDEPLVVTPADAPPSATPSLAPPPPTPALQSSPSSEPPPDSQRSPDVPTETPPPLSKWWLWFAPASAFAATAATVDHSRDTQGWVVEDETDVMAYLGRVGATLSRVSDAVAKSHKLDNRDAELLAKILPVTAWQESCWRQFRKKKGVATYMRSSRGSVGIMQVNERVWRGFYEVERLRWQIAYNAEAGTEVLLHYFELVDDPPQGVPKPTTLRDRARAVYAAYNGGPEQLRRYLDSTRRDKALSRVIDDLFGAKFDGTSEIRGQVAACLGAEPP